MVPFLGRDTSFEPSVVEPGEVDRPLIAGSGGDMAGSCPAEAEALVDGIDGCLGGSAGGGGLGVSVESMRVIGPSATPVTPSGRTEYEGGGLDLPRGGSGGGAGFEPAMVVPSHDRDPRAGYSRATWGYK